MAGKNEIIMDDEDGYCEECYCWEDEHDEDCNNWGTTVATRRLKSSGR